MLQLALHSCKDIQKLWGEKRIFTLQWYESCNCKLCSGLIDGKELEKSCCKPCPSVSSSLKFHWEDFAFKIGTLGWTTSSNISYWLGPVGSWPYILLYIYNLERSTTPAFWFTRNIKPVRIQLFVNEKVIIIENHRLLRLTLFIPHSDGWNNNWPLPAITFNIFIWKMSCLTSGFKGAACGYKTKIWGPG